MKSLPQSASSIAAALAFLSGNFVACTHGVSGTTGTGSGTSSTGGASGTGGTSSVSGTGATTGTLASSTASGAPDPCAPAEGASIAASCGVFVSASAPLGGTGSQASPYPSIAAAAAGLSASTNAIYVCGSDTFKSSVVVRGGVSIFGGFQCATWTFSASNAHPIIAGAPDKPALDIVTDATETLDSVNVHAADSAMPGGSSIGILVNRGKLSVARAEIIAGAGYVGAHGTDADQSVLPSGTNGNTGGMSTGNCDTSSKPPVPGAASVSLTCNGIATIGGQGGDGTDNVGQNGSPGQTGTAGQAGAGQSGAGWSCATVGNGKTGSGGAAGAAGKQGGLATLDASGFTPSNAGTGSVGAPGQGGGGGGGFGNSGTQACGINYIVSGASGGSGGTGGCGGAGGQGGQGGGSSFGIVAIESSITVTHATITSNAAGTGGSGGAYQPGAKGGTGGPGNGFNPDRSCKGGDGGPGGNGGGGGGGNGGDSAPIVFTGAAAPMVDATVGLTKGAPGGGGTSPASGSNPVTGAVGTACSVLAFSMNLCTTQ